MNGRSLHSLTVKYLGSLSPIILMCIFDSVGMTPAMSAASHSPHCILYVLLLIIFIAMCTWIYMVCTLINTSIPYGTLKSEAVGRIHTRVCLPVWYAREICTYMGRSACVAYCR